MLLVGGQLVSFIHHGHHALLPVSVVAGAAYVAAGVLIQRRLNAAWQSCPNDHALVPPDRALAAGMTESIVAVDAGNVRL